MILYFTDEEMKALEAFEAGAKKLLDDAEEEINKLRPDRALFEGKLDQLEAQQPTPPPMPEPIGEDDGMPVYSKEEIDAYHESPEYKAYIEEDKRIFFAILDLRDEYEKTGSAEWKAAKEKYRKLEEDLFQSRRDFYKKVEDRQFSALADDPTKILADANIQVNQLIVNRYNYYDRKRNESSFSASDVRVQDDGNIRLDTDKTKEFLLEQLERHIKALPDEFREELDKSIDLTLNTNPFVSDTGKRGALVSKKETTEKKEAEKGLTVNRPREYKYPNSKVSNMVFKRELTTEDPNHFEPVGLNRKKDIVTYANFTKPRNVVDMPDLDAYGERLYGAVGSCLFAGNDFIPFVTLYNRGMLGLTPKEKNREVTSEIKKDMLEGLEQFLGQVTIDNDPTGVYSKNDPDFYREIIKESLLFYQVREEIVHGQITEGIAIPRGYVPVLYRYSENNNDEIITDRIENIHVEGLNYSRLNMGIMSATYDRVKEIQYFNSQKRYKAEIPEKQRTIRYDFIAERASLKYSELTDDEKNKPRIERAKIMYSKLSQPERTRLKSKIDKCMKSYQASGLFDRYEHKKDNTKSFYAVVLYFEPEPKKLKESS